MIHDVKRPHAYDDPKPRMMLERYPNLKEEVGGSNPGCEISSLLDGKTC